MLSFGRVFLTYPRPLVRRQLLRQGREVGVGVVPEQGHVEGHGQVGVERGQEAHQGIEELAAAVNNCLKCRVVTILRVLAAS
jgi:hypothetical protein